MQGTGRAPWGNTTSLTCGATVWTVQGAESQLSDNVSRLGYVQLCYDVIEYGKYWEHDLLKVMRVFGDAIGVTTAPSNERKERLMK